MAKIEALREKYKSLDEHLQGRTESSIDPTCLLTFDYEYAGQDSGVVIDTEEFTAVCPWNDLPDFGTVTVSYVPDRSCIELKSLKLYFWSYRDEGVFFEAATNRILDDLVAACDPVEMTVIGKFNVRGGIAHEITAVHP